MQLNTMKNNKLFCRDISLHLPIVQNGRKRQLEKSDCDNHMVSIQSPNGYLFHKVYFFHTLLENNKKFLYYVLKQCLSGLELIMAHWGILYCSPMFNPI